MTASVLSVTITGSVGPGSCSASGLLQGDLVLAVKGGTGNFAPANSFEQFVSVANALQQVDGDDLSAYTFNVLIARW